MFKIVLISKFYFLFFQQSERFSPFFLCVCSSRA
jgi:hypothetical protein